MIYKSTSTCTRMGTGIFRINVIISLVLCLILLISPSQAFQRTIFKKLRSELNLSRADERRAFAPAFSPPLLSFLTKKSLLDVPRGGHQDQELNGDNHEAEANEDEDEYEYEQESSEDEEDLPDDELISSSSYTSTSSVESQLQSLGDADTITDTDTGTGTDTADTSTAAAASPSKSESKQSESSLAIWGSVSSAFQMNIDAKDELIHNNTNTITTNNANECEHDFANTIPDTDTVSDTDNTRLKIGNIIIDYL